MADTASESVKRLRSDLRATEDRAIERIARQARSAGETALSATLITIAKKAMIIAQKKRGADNINTAAAELRTLRLDADVSAAINRDLEAFGRYLIDAMPDWIAHGWLIQARGQAAILKAESDAIKVTVELTDDDRTDLVDYPVMGRSSKENAAWLVQVLRRSIEDALGLCLLTTGADAVVAQVGIVSAQNGGRLAQSARQCFLAGLGAARESIANALVGR